MIHVARESEKLWICSMGKHFLVRAVADSDAEANVYMERHRDTGCIACFGPFVLVANLHEGETKHAAVLP